MDQCYFVVLALVNQISKKAVEVSDAGEFATFQRKLLIQSCHSQIKARLSQETSVNLVPNAVLPVASSCEYQERTL